MNPATATMNTNVAPERVRYWPAFRQMPVVLQAYAGISGISLVFVFLGLAAMFWPSAKRWMQPWSEPAFFNFYLLTISVMASLPTKHQMRKLLVGCLFLMLLMGLLMGIADTLELLSDVAVTMAAQTTQPSLKHHPVRPVFHVAVPAFWFLMLLSPQVRRWMRTPPEEGPVPFSLVDLFYCVFVAAVCTSLSIALVGFARHRLDVGQTYAELLAKSKAAAQASPSPSKTP